LEAGATIPAEARSALLTSVAAIFLISARYLASGFMRSDFEKLLDQAEERGVRMLWIRAGTCDLSDIDRLTRYQLVCPRASPLNRMREARQDEVYTELVKAIKIQLVRSGRLLAQ
jgi:hypothetical protein